MLADGSRICRDNGGSGRNRYYCHAAAINEELRNKKQKIKIYLILQRGKL